jgi:hypothetical protein
MRRTSDIIFGVPGQGLTYRFPTGRPTSATFRVLDEAADDENSEVEFEGSATVESVNTTIATAAGVGQTDRTAITLAAGTATAGRDYLLAQNGKREWVRVVSAVGTSIVAGAPLQNAYTTGATFQATLLSAAVDSDWVVDEANLSDASDPAPDYRVRWEVTYGSETIIALSFFDLVRGSLGHGLTMQDLEARFWNLLADMPTDHRADQGGRILDAAWEDVQADLASIALNDAALRDAQLVDQLLIHRVRLAFAENGHRPQSFSAAEFLTFAAATYDRFFEQHFKVSSHIKTARGTSAGARAAAAPPFMRK